MRGKGFLGISWSVHPPEMGIPWGLIPSLFQWKFFHPGTGQFPMEEPNPARCFHGLEFPGISHGIPSIPPRIPTGQNAGQKNFHGTQNQGQEEELLLLPRIHFSFGIPRESQCGEIPDPPGILIPTVGFIPHSRNPG